MKTIVDIIMNEKEFVSSMLETGDRDALDLYLNWKLIWNKDRYAGYDRRFGLCRLLDIHHIYDIGCGIFPQALMLTYPEIHYTGIDCNMDEEKMNQRFSNGFGQRVKFVKAMYPCELTPPQNNIALATGMMYSEESDLKKIASDFSQDFERIITNFRLTDTGYDEHLRFWENNLPEFRVMKLELRQKNPVFDTKIQENLLFATKIPHDLQIMEEVNYSYADDRFGIMAPELHTLYNKIHSNP